MKYMKSYKGRSETIAKKIREDIKDICLELEDEGFSTITHKAGLAGNLECLFIGIGNSRCITNKKAEFKYGEISEVIERLKEYLGDKIREIEINKEYISRELAWFKYDEFTKMFPDILQTDIKGIRIYYETSKG